MREDLREQIEERRLRRKHRAERENALSLACARKGCGHTLVWHDGPTPIESPCYKRDCKCVTWVSPEEGDEGT